jgi:hypothetical protein
VGTTVGRGVRTAAGVRVGFVGPATEPPPAIAVGRALGGLLAIGELVAGGKDAGGNDAGGNDAGGNDAGGGAVGVAEAVGVGVGTGGALGAGVAEGRPATVVGTGEAAAVSPVGRGPVGDGPGRPKVPMASANVARTRFRIPRAMTSRARCADVTTMESPQPVGH